MRRSAVAGQSISDYAVAVALATVVLVTMQTFIRRYVQAEVKGTTDTFLSVTEEDATNPVAAQRGMNTQRLGTETRRNNTGLNRTNVLFDAHTDVSRGLREEPVGAGKMLVVTQDTSMVHRTGDQHTEVLRQQPPTMVLPPGRWFHRGEQGAPTGPPRTTDPSKRHTPVGPDGAGGSP